MNSAELDREAGFLASRRVQVLKSTYRLILERQCANMLARPDVVDFTDIWNDISEHILEYHSQYDLDVFLYRCLRDACLKLIRLGRTIPAPNNEVLQEFAKHPGAPMSNSEKEQVCMLLSMMNRKQFNYFIKRYFYFDLDTPYNARIEKQIQKIFQLRGDASVLRWAHAMPAPTCNAAYVRCLEGLSDFFLDQIHRKGTMISHPSANKFPILQRRLYIARRVTPIAIIISLLCCIAIYFGLL